MSYATYVRYPPEESYSDVPRLLVNGTCTIHVSAVLLLPQKQRNISIFRTPGDPLLGSFLYTVVAESGTGICLYLQQ